MTAGLIVVGGKVLPRDAQPKPTGQHPGRASRPRLRELVAHVTQTVLDRGDGAFAVLSTNLANPTSNAIYQAIGYAPVGDFVELRF